MRTALATLHCAFCRTLTIIPPQLTTAIRKLSFEQLMLECPDVLPRPGDRPLKLHMHKTYTAEEAVGIEM